MQPKFRFFVAGEMFRVYSLDFGPAKPRLGTRVNVKDGGTLGFPLHAGSLMQWTGLRDKYKREIYEGDILKIELNNSEGNPILKPCPVIFKNGSFRLEPKYYDGRPAEYHYEHLGDCKMKTFEVIGNIHEHPDLLK